MFLLLSIYLCIIVYSTSFIISIVKTSSCPNHPNMRGFYVYCFLALLISLTLLAMKNNIVTLKFYTTFNFFLAIFHYVFLGTLIVKATKTKFKLALRIVFYSYLLFCLTSIYLTFFLKIMEDYYIIAIANFGLISLSLFYYNSLFDLNSKSNFYKSPEFWVINGIVFGLGINIPAHTFPKSTFKIEHIHIANFIGAVGILGYILMHLFFIKAFLLCSKQI